MSEVNKVDWFQIGTDQPEAVERFYGDVFGWTFAGEPGYRLVFTPGSQAPGGGVADVSGDTTGNHAIPFVNVADTAETCRRAEAAGAKVLVAPQDGGDGLIFAHLIDPTGNHIGVYTPAAR